MILRIIRKRALLLVLRVSVWASERLADDLVPDWRQRPPAA